MFKEGFQNSQSYLISGHPYVYTSTTAGKLEFDFVSRTIVVTASGDDAYIWFKKGTPTERRFLIKSGTTIDLPIRIINLWYEPQGSGTISICGILTSIERSAYPARNFNELTGI